VLHPPPPVLWPPSPPVVTRPPRGARPKLSSTLAPSWGARNTTGGLSRGGKPCGCLAASWTGSLDPDPARGSQTPSIWGGLPRRGRPSRARRPRSHDGRAGAQRAWPAGGIGHPRRIGTAHGGAPGLVCAPGVAARPLRRSPSRAVRTPRTGRCRAAGRACRCRAGPG
jgi:hypothetical protein